MPRPAWSKLSPWIESLILSYGSEEGNTSGRLKAHVIGVGQMSQSQAQGSEGPTGLLFLSDGVLQIPAILTASAWEHLQEQEDRECFTSLVNTTVCIQDYQLQFHMAHEQTKCRFILSVGQLATMAAGPVKDSTPCSTTLHSIRMKICKTWRALLGEETQDSEKSQCGFDLSELLGEWQHDCLQAVLEDVRERLMVASSHPVSPQPSTSTCNSALTHPDAFTATSWSVDRVRYKEEKCFTVPIKCLLIPDADAQQLQSPPDAESRTASGLSAASVDRKRDLPQVCKASETTQPSVDDAEWRIAMPAVVEKDGHTSENSSHPTEDSMLDEDTIVAMMDSDIRPLSNPWDIFPPPLSDTSPEATPPQSLHSSKESQQTSEHSKGEQSYLPPYQKQPHSTSFPATAGSSASSPREPFTTLSNPPPATEEQHASTAQLHPPALDQESQILEKDTEETVERKYRKAKRKRSEPTPEALTTLIEEEEAQISGSPPSWLFDSLTGSGAEEGCDDEQGQTRGSVLRKRPTVHSDGGLFSYSYQVSGQNLLDFSRFKVTQSLLHWGVKYLVTPKQTDNAHNTSATSCQPNI